uniref:COP9 signalosome complex subunit 3 n=1 Tax=Coccolithus braarudii TaxID=221442 RepID=A0A7S0L4U1_9EUKA|mmetsp:Transcript_20491/g.43967  ORF Transcript_20491/g.43967 Transcript_20491/m.43967 type:complete len:435 (+) Transcript_20491:113-1417(+)
MDGPLGDLLSSVERLSESSSLSQLLALLNANEELLIKHLPLLDDLLPVLCPRLNSLGMVYILNCKAATVPLSNMQAVNVFIQQCRRLLLDCDPVQVQMVPAQFVAVCNKFSAAALAIKSPIVAVRPLQAAALALQPTQTHFTQIHAEFMKVCLLSKCYSVAEPLLYRSKELLHVDREATHVTPRDLLLYHYYAGMIEIGLKNFKSAIQYFTLCFSAPSNVLNAIMVEAYKKCLLCSLIEHGEQPRMPRYTSLSITRHVKNGIAPYTELAEAFAMRKASDLQQALEKHADIHRKDGTFGLAKQTVQALIRRNIHRLTQTYLTLSLAHIAESVELSSAQEAECYIVRMVSKGEISAKIDEAQGMVHFTELPERFDTAATAVDMEAKIGAVIGLTEKLHEMNSQLVVDSNYISRMARERQPRGWNEDEAMEAAPKFR